ncbi:MAG: 2-oxoglutarate dehydrogenase E2 component (dihydrolipoamide succinyltransferase) [Rhodothermales bacterium]|jgi:2-oxoglutarate dehydrogenase E2 component (dihydrolipoamide succinyltransferase)
MKIDIVVPNASESVTEADIARWYKESGDFVSMDEPLVELETDKASLEVCANAEGVLTITVPSGETVAVESVIGNIDTEAVNSSAGSVAAPEPVAGVPATPTPEPEVVREEPEVDLARTSCVKNRSLPSPAARKLLAEHNISAQDVEGTGSRGHITKADVLRFIKEQVKKAQRTQVLENPFIHPHESSSPVVAADETLSLDRSAIGRSAKDSAAKLPSDVKRSAAPNFPASPPVGLTDSRPVRRERMSRLRRTIAARLVEAQQTAALLTTFNEVDMSGIMAIRSAYKEEFAKAHETGLGFMGFFVAACCRALEAFPAVNASVEGDEIIYHDYADIGIAVSTPRGLVVPPVHNADQMKLHEIEAAIRALAAKGREGKLSLDELSGGTFTITNGGVFGSMLSTPIVNRPQSAILGMHNIVQRPVAVDGQVVIRPIMYVALTYDHRIIDGAEAVQFLVKVKQALEDPTRLLLGL